jgi:type IV pilus assembly protein PilW
MNVLCANSPAFRRSAHRRSLALRQAGLTLLELMISLTLGLLLVAGIGTIYVGSNQTYRVQEENARIQESGRYALEVIGRNIRQAGADAPISYTPTALTLDCLPTTTPACVAINGTDNSTNGTAFDTLTTQLYANPDEFNPTPNQWGIRDCTGGFVQQGTLVTNAFAMNGTDLRCTGSVGGAAPLISNVEDFQVLYGIDTDNNQAANQYSAVPPANLNLVVSVRVCVLVFSAAQGITTGRQTYLNCGGALGTLTGANAFTQAAAGDSRLHRAFVATFNLRNRVNNLP